MSLLKILDRIFFTDTQVMFDQFNLFIVSIVNISLEHS